jgi:hypothetical protein
MLVRCNILLQVHFTLRQSLASPQLHDWQTQTASNDVGFSAALVVGVLVILFFSALNLQARPDGYLYVFMIDDTIYIG